MKIEITGKQGCGKTTIANKIKAILESEGKMVAILDQDEGSPVKTSTISIQLSSPAFDRKSP